MNKRAAVGYGAGGGKGGTRRGAGLGEGGQGNANRVIRFRCGFTNTILDVLRNRGWNHVTEEGADWDFYWCDVGWMREVFDHCYMDEGARICHFRNHYELTRKNLMVKNFKRYRKQLEREAATAGGKSEALKMDFYPPTFELPTEYHMFVEEFKKHPSATWIMKPAAKSQGKGIFLFRKLKDITDWKKNSVYKPASQQNHQDSQGEKEAQVETYVVCKYIDNPYLVGNKKFDVRFYVLVCCYAPLKVWLYREAFARFSTVRYNLESIEDNVVHLTNVAIQKLAPDYDPERDCKWSFASLKRYLTAKHGNEEVAQLMREIDELVIYSLKSVQKIIINDKHCFELYGYDIMLDTAMKPWLLEVNASPSLTASSPQDYELKYRLLDDMVTVIDMENRLTGKEKRIGGFDLMWHDGPVLVNDGGVEYTSAPGHCTNSFLGCSNENRQKQLKQMMRQANIAKRHNNPTQPNQNTSVQQSAAAGVA
ncbi:probable tubulin polyglutamylase TTLL9 [Symsagittifera roscoffensis]|uniref:probable tubulin polyglutamylase TTLL9 n=1 Tax=Symsagittifera roscoffensis TaxID=84072 RepID=UPI00307BA961